MNVLWNQSIKLLPQSNFGNINKEDIDKLISSIKSILDLSVSSTRLYGINEKLDFNLVHDFWNMRSIDNSSVKGVLLGEGLVKNSAILRNVKEKQILRRFLCQDKKYNIFDIGCGIGRWVDNLSDHIETYLGIDFVDNFVKDGNEKFKNNPNVNFINMSVTNLKDNMLKQYDLIILNGICMYINDSELDILFDKLNGYLNLNGYVYLQESVSTINERLTLKDFFSKDLNTNYNAIYRTKQEYDFVIEKKLKSIKLLYSDFLLDESIGKRSETNAFYWFLQKN